jgi:nitric oxide synthase-interacting protein
MTLVRTPDPHHPELEHDVLRCYVCETDLTGEEAQAAAADGKGKEKKKKGKQEKEGLKPGLVELRSEGTGFAGGGGNVVKKEGVVFQC